jgi:hypothetical protein
MSHQNVKSRCYCVAHDLRRQAHFHGTLSNRARWVSVNLNSIRIGKSLWHLYSFSIFLHLATGCWLLKRSDSNCTSYLRKRLWVHFKRCGGPYIVAIAWFWNWKNGSLVVEPNSFMALTLLVPMSQTVATCSPTFWHAPRTSFKNYTSISALVLLRLRQ